MKQVTHLAVTIQRPNHLLTTTLCRRMNAKTKDGINSTEQKPEVTCKFCINKMRAQ